ncbi:hypothetical protein V8F33_013941 [Rhypophila sp. PSN 637]
MLSFLSTEPMQGDPSCKWENFKNAKLRRFPGELSAFRWERYIGTGEDGVVLEARLDDGTPVAVKIFRHSEHPEPINGFRFYWAFQRECHNCAILEMITTSIKKASLAGNHIYIHPKPREHRDACLNLKAFSAEAADKSPVPPVNFQPFRPDVLPNTCLGWMELSGKEARALFHMLQAFAPDMPADKSYFAIVYLFVPEGQLNDTVIQSQMDFFYLTGFVCPAYKEDNWRGSGILVDFSDIVSPLSSSWQRLLYGRKIKRRVGTQGVEMWGQETPYRPD